MLQVQIIQLDEDGRGEFVLKATFDHPYLTTKIMWIPNQATLIAHVHKNYSKNFPPYVSIHESSMIMKKYIHVYVFVTRSSLSHVTSSELAPSFTNFAGIVH